MPQCKPEQLELAPHAAEHLSPPSEIDTNVSTKNKTCQQHQHRAALEPCLRMCKKCKILPKESLIHGSANKFLQCLSAWFPLERW